MLPRRIAAAAFAALVVATAIPAQSAATTVRLHVQNAWYGSRREVIRVSVPFAESAANDLGAYAVRGHQTAWLPLTHWPDGSVQWAQAQFVATLAGGKTREFVVVKGKGAIPNDRQFVAGPRLLASILAGAVHTEVEDTFGVVYEAGLEPDPTAGPRGLLRQTPLAATYRFHAFHKPKDANVRGIGRDFLTLTAYLTLFHGFEHAELTVILGNDYLGADQPEGDDPNLHPLGTVRLRRFSLVVRDPTLAFVPRWIRENELKPPKPILDGDSHVTGWRQDLLGPAPGLYLGDGCIKAFPIVLFAPWGDPSKAPAGEDEALRRRTATALAEAPLYGLPHVDDVRRTHALNAHGGPAPVTPSVAGRAAREFESWRTRDHFGPFGTWGDVAATPTTGTPRNTTIGLHLALRSGSRDLMLRAEAKCLQQGLRPYHLWGLKVPPEQDIYVEGLPKYAGKWVSKETLGRRHLPEAAKRHREGLILPYGGPYGMNPFDYEHFTVDFLYDFYCLTGSPFARDELRVLGEQLKGMLRPRTYYFSKAQTTRGEGWCMKGLVLCWLATGDDSIKNHAIARIPALQAALGKPPNTYAVAQPPDPRAFGPGVEWDAPWQQAAYVMGMAAAYRYFGDERFRKLAIDVGHYMALQGWDEGKGPKYFVACKNPTQFQQGLTAGTAEFESAAFLLAADCAKAAGQAQDYELFMKRGVELFELHLPVGLDGLMSRKWWQIWFDRFPSGRPER